MASRYILLLPGWCCCCQQSCCIQTTNLITALCCSKPHHIFNHFPMPWTVFSACILNLPILSEHDKCLTVVCGACIAWMPLVLAQTFGGLSYSGFCIPGSCTHHMRVGLCKGCHYGGPVPQVDAVYSCRYFLGVHIWNTDWLLQSEREWNKSSRIFKYIP